MDLIVRLLWLGGAVWPGAAGNPATACGCLHRGLRGVRMQAGFGALLTLTSDVIQIVDLRDYFRHQQRGIAFDCAMGCARSAWTLPVRCRSW